MKNTLNLGAVQFAPTANQRENLLIVAGLIKRAAESGAQIICIPELFYLPYFCKSQDETYFSLAKPEDSHPVIDFMQDIAAKYSVCMPVSFFEKDGPHYHNSVVMLNADGKRLGKYRKTHIPDGPGYQEKFYFKPGELLPQVFDTKYGRIGVGICWDQWFPEIARHLVLAGAEAILYPTAIGAEPQDPSLDTQARWHRIMQGHAAANVVPIVAANRIGSEEGQSFYGSTCIISPDGSIVAELGRQEAGIASYGFDSQVIETERAAWGFFRDRRTDLY